MIIAMYKDRLLIYNIGNYSDLMLKTLNKICKQNKATVSVKQGCMCIVSKEETLYKILLDLQCYTDICLK